MNLDQVKHDSNLCIFTVSFKLQFGFALNFHKIWNFVFQKKWHNFPLSLWNWTEHYWCCTWLLDLPTLLLPVLLLFIYFYLYFKIPFELWNKWSQKQTAFNFYLIIIVSRQSNWTFINNVMEIRPKNDPLYPQLCIKIAVYPNLCI